LDFEIFWLPSQNGNVRESAQLHMGRLSAEVEGSGRILLLRVVSMPRK
jgi:hypothetical protein